MGATGRLRRTTGAGVLLALSAAACAGPRAPLDIGTQTAPIALVLGELKAVQQAPVGPISSPPAPDQLPYYQPGPGVPLFPTIPPAPPGPCPEFDKTAPVLAVGRRVVAPPVKAQYRYRGLVVDLFPGKTLTFAGDSVWSVQSGPVDATTGAFDVTYTVKFGASTTTRVLRTLPRDIGSADGSEPNNQTNANTLIATANSYLTSLGGPEIPRGAPNPAGYGLAGVYLVSQQSANAAGGVDTFTPATPIALVQLRQLTGVTDAASTAAEAITSAGYDPTTGAVMAFRSTVVQPTNKLNACGTPLQSVQVNLTSPYTKPAEAPGAPLPVPVDTGGAVFAQRAPSSTPTEPKSHVILFGEQIDFGLQYGGLILHDKVTVAPLSGYQIDASNPPAPPDPMPSDPAKVSEAVLTMFLTWATKHMIMKNEEFTINSEPTLPKAS